MHRVKNRRILMERMSSTVPRTDTAPENFIKNWSNAPTANPIFVLYFKFLTNLWPAVPLVVPITQWRRQDFVTGGEVRYGSIGGLEYEVPQPRLYCLCINVALCSTALQCICRVIRRSSMTMKAHTYYIIFGRPPIGGKLPPSPLAAPLLESRTSYTRPRLVFAS